MTLFISLCALNTTALTAEETPPVPDGIYDYPQESLDTIFGGKDYGYDKNKLRLRLRNHKISPPEIFNSPPRFETIKWFAAHLVRILAVAAVLALIVIIVMHIRKFSRDAIHGKRPPQQKKETGTSPEFPGALLEQAHAAFDSGNVRAAAALCYQTALAAFISMGVPFPPCATEYECLNCVRAACGEGMAAFQLIIRSRVTTAYRGIDITREDFETNIRHCKELILMAHRYQDNGGRSQRDSAA
ncbi:MAG: hypothetical protein LBD22_06790 [Spirochaetaceae bacterium]|nr:hypothetical protein [Spirochaetaceae bacterium]